MNLGLLQQTAALPAIAGMNGSALNPLAKSISDTCECWLAFILAKPIRGEDAKNLGAIAIAMALGDLTKTTITTTKIGESGYVIPLDQAKRPTADGQGEVSSGLRFSSHPLLSQRNRFDHDTFIIEENSKKIKVYLEKIGKAGPVSSSRPPRTRLSAMPRFCCSSRS